MQSPRFDSWVEKTPWRRDRLPTPVFLGFPVAQLVKNPPAIWETWGLIPGLERSPGEGKGYPLQYSGLENPRDYTVHGVAKSRTRLSDFQKTKIMASGPITHGKQMGETVKTVAAFLFWAPESVWTVSAAMKSKDTCSLEKK